MKIHAYANAQDDGRSETAIQIEVAGWLKKWLAPPAFFTAFPAGGGGYHRGRTLKAMGLKAGMPDLMIFFAGTAFFIEMKRPRTGRASADQKAMWKTLGEALPNCRIAECRSLEEVKEAVSFWGIPLRSQSVNNLKMQISLDREFKSWRNPHR